MDLHLAPLGKAPLIFSSFTPPRPVKIGDAASFVGITQRAIRHYHQIGLLPEPERGSDGRRRYGYDEMIQLLWVRKMTDAGIALNEIRDAFADTTLIDTGAGSGIDVNIEHVLERLEITLAAKEAELQRQRATVQRMRARGSRMGLLSDFVTSRLDNLPEGSLRRADLDSLLVMERVFGPLGAAVSASRYIALAIHPGLREESDRVDAAEEALDDMVAIDDPRVAQVAAKRHAFELALHVVIEDSGLAEDDDALFDSWDALHPPTAEHPEDEDSQSSSSGQVSMSAVEAVGKMPYNFSAARPRCMELAEKLAADESPAS